jgi:hypothetical protein
MLIGATKKGDPIVAELAPQSAGERVGRQRLIGTADMGCTVTVKNGGSYMDSLTHRNY